MFYVMVSDYRNRGRLGKQILRSFLRWNVLCAFSNSRIARNAGITSSLGNPNFGHPGRWIVKPSNSPILLINSSFRSGEAKKTDRTFVRSIESFGLEGGSPDPTVSAEACRTGRGPTVRGLRCKFPRC